MSALWTSPSPLTTTALRELLTPYRPVAYTTVITVAERLREKGWVTRHKEGRAFLYAPTVTEDQYSAHLMGEALRASSNRSAALLSFAGTLDPAEVEALRAALDGDPEG